MKAGFQGSGKMEEAMDEFRVEQRGKQMTERAAMRAEQGIRSRPAAQLRFREARTSSHHALRCGGGERKGRWRRPSRE